jgi:hypothetical protein
MLQAELKREASSNSKALEWGLSSLIHSVLELLGVLTNFFVRSSTAIGSSVALLYRKANVQWEKAIIRDG